MNQDNTDMMRRGMSCLVEVLGSFEATQFIYLIKADKFDYTEWQREYFDNMSLEELDRDIMEYAKAHPFHGDKAVIL